MKQVEKTECEKIKAALKTYNLIDKKIKLIKLATEMENFIDYISKVENKPIIERVNKLIELKEQVFYLNIASDINNIYKMIKEVKEKRVNED